MKILEWVKIFVVHMSYKDTYRIYKNSIKKSRQFDSKCLRVKHAPHKIGYPNEQYVYYSSRNLFIY